MALIVGIALALDSPVAELADARAMAFLAGVFCGATMLLLAIVELTTMLSRDWQRIGMRIAGSWIGAIAIIVLALRLAGR